jgi:SAM-dependent methyltransferase
MPPVITDRTGYWDHYAGGVTHETPEEALKNAFGWTQYEGHGPGDELLATPVTALELGAGRGNAVAALATKGIDATGIDISPAQVTDARNRWGQLPGARYLQDDVAGFLAATAQRWEAIYSIWGALWFTDPALLLPVVHDRLTPGGKLVFSHAPAVPGSYGIQGMYGNGFTGRQVWIYRWAYEPSTWAELLAEHGFVEIHARIEPAPAPDNVGTLLVEAQRAQ